MVMGPVSQLTCELTYFCKKDIVQRGDFCEVDTCDVCDGCGAFTCEAAAHFLLVKQPPRCYL